MTVIRGGRLALRDTGRGRPVIWGHGLTSSMTAEDAAGLFGWLAEDALPGVRLIRYDARGHGRSDPGADDGAYRWPELARDMTAVADAAGIDRFVAAGASMGAATSLWVAVTDPERLDAMILVIPPTAWETRAAQAGLYLERAAVIRELGLAGMVEASAALPPPPLFAPHPEVVAQQSRNLAANDETALPVIFTGAAASDLPERDSLRAVRIPTLILAWDGDPGHPVTTAEELHGLLAGSELHVARHLDEVAGWPGAVRQFLAATA